MTDCTLLPGLLVESTTALTVVKDQLSGGEPRLAYFSHSDVRLHKCCSERPSITRSRSFSRGDGFDTELMARRPRLLAEEACVGDGRVGLSRLECRRRAQVARSDTSTSTASQPLRPAGFSKRSAP